MQHGLKPKKCRLRECGKEYMPAVRWQYYCSPKCAWTVRNRRNGALMKKAKAALARQEQGETDGNQI